MKDFLTWDLTKTLYNISYDGDTFLWIDDENDIINDSSIEILGGVRAILYSQAFRWFRDEHNLWKEVKVQDNVRLGEQKFYWLIFGEYTSFEGNSWIRAKADSNGVYYDTYKEAQDACLKKLIEIVKEKAI